MNLTDKSKFLSFVLRHKPEAAGLTLDSEGWVYIADLLGASTKTPLTRDEVLKIVAEDKKGRYSISDDELKIRANQGHSTSQVRLTFKKGVPPIPLYHGTAEGALHKIFKQGLLPMARHHVHLSKDIETAKDVGGRRKSGIAILEVDTKAMLADGFQFFISENNVWLTESVPPKYLKEIT